MCSFIQPHLPSSYSVPEYFYINLLQPLFWQKQIVNPFMNTAGLPWASSLIPTEATRKVSWGREMAWEPRQESPSHVRKAGAQGTCL